MKKSDLKNYIRENIISTLEEDIAADTKALEDYESKLDDVIKKKQEAGIEEQVDKFNVDVFGYKTKYYKVCPGAKAFMDKVMAGDYGDMSDIKEETIRLAKLHDVLFKMEIEALRDSNYAAKIINRAEFVVDTIRDQVDMINKLSGKNIPMDAVDYLDNHVEIIKDAAKKRDQIAADDMLEEVKVDIPTPTITKYNQGVTDVKSAAQAILDFYSQIQDKEQIDYMKNQQFKIAMDKLKNLAKTEDPVTEEEEPSDSEIRKNKSLAKAAEELAILQSEMKSLAKKYSKAKGQEKENLLNTLKSKTKLKKELESILDKKL